VGKQQLLLGATSSNIAMLSTIPVGASEDSTVSEKGRKKQPESKVSFRKILEAIR
jgi:flagellar biogenesis protein FliO